MVAHQLLNASNQRALQFKQVGENLATRSTRMPWHAGPALPESLKSIEADRVRAATLPFRMTVQRVSRPHWDNCEIDGAIASGVVRPGARVHIQLSGVMCTIVHIGSPEGVQPQRGRGKR